MVLHNCSNAFARVNTLDARGSTFNNVGRDQITNNNWFLFGSCHRCTHCQLPLNPNYNPPRPTGPDFLPQGSHLVTYRSDAIPDIEATTGVIDQITHYLYDHKYSSNDHHDLVVELESLHQTLTLTKLTIQQYDKTPLGQSMANMVTPEVELCFVALQELLGSIDGIRLCLSFTRIGDLWRHVLWALLGGGEFALLRKNLSYSRQSLQELLVTMHSVAWMELGNELRAGLATLRRFHNLNNQRLPSLYHIKLNAVEVVSHLGDTIPVPTVFCSTWKDFDYVVRVHCRDRFGITFIERGDYEVLRAEDSQIVSPSEFSSTVQSGMKLEMSILLRLETALQDTNGECPRCHYINLNVTVDRGWIQCQKCSGQFQITEASLNRQDEEGNTGGGDKERGGMVDEELSGEGNEEKGDEEIVSPASQTSEPSSTGERQQQDDDGRQFFRRIRVVWIDYDVDSSGMIGSPGSSTLDLDGEGIGSPRSSIHDGEVHTTVHVDDVLHHMLNGARYDVDVDDLVQSALESFQQIVEFCEAKSAHGHPAVIALEKEVRVMYGDYLKAIETSVKVAGHGITFAADAACLFEYLSQDPSTDVRSFINEIKKTAGQAHRDAAGTYKKFCAVRNTLLLIIKRIARQEMQIKDGHDDHKRGRNMDQDPLVALELLNKATNSVDRVVECVNKFANWWGNAESMTSTLGNQVVPADGRRLSTIRIHMVRKSWEVLQKEYEVYKRSINTLSDFYPVDKMQTSAPWFKKIFTRKPTRQK